MDNIPDYCEPLTAYRGWFGWDGLTLKSGPETDVRWEPFQVLKAEHRRFPLNTFNNRRDLVMDYLDPVVCESPCERFNQNHTYGCGIYGLKTKAQLENVYQSNYIWGEVSLWGRIWEHEHGYRAQFAYPKKLLWVPESIDGLALAAHYGITYQQEEAWKSENRSGSLSQSQSAVLFQNAQYLQYLSHQNRLQYQQNQLANLSQLAQLQPSTHSWWRRLVP